jgi:DNA-binding transcriptional ArsR family regulator/precorrin-6B methylase 2
MRMNALCLGVMTPRSELFRLFAEEGRLQVLALCGEAELSVGELSSLLKDSQPQLSRKVAALKQAHLVETRRDGTRTWVKRVNGNDPLVAEALAEGRRLCLKDGSLARLPKVVARREERGVEHFEEAAQTSVPATPQHLAHLSALSGILPGRGLAIDVGTGDGVNLDVLSPLYQRVIAVDRSRSQLARVLDRVAQRGFTNVSVFEGSYEDAALVQRTDAAGGADLVFAGRTLHHASRPDVAVRAFSRLLKPGGQLVVLDYLAHQDEAMREQGDVWLGFEPKVVEQYLSDAGLQLQSSSEVPPAFHVDGPDRALDWHAYVATKPQPGGHRTEG